MSFKVPRSDSVRKPLVDRVVVDKETGNFMFCYLYQICFYYDMILNFNALVYKKFNLFAEEVTR